VITFRALTTNVSVAIADDLPGAELARALIESYPPATTAELRYELDATCVRRNGEQLALADPADFVPLFEMDLYEQVGTRAAPGWLLHAAALDVDGRALVLCGPSGAGKTTLTLALASSGLRLLTEEVVWIDKAGSVRGLPRPLHVPERSAQRAQIPAPWKTLPYPIRDRLGEVSDNLLVVPPREAFVFDALPLRAIVRIGHGADWPTYLRESPHHVALQRLWDRSLRQDDSGLEAATSVLREHGSFELSSTSVTQALSLLEPLLK
jgi:adenylate kinase family enzyme